MNHAYAVCITTMFNPKAVTITFNICEIWLSWAMSSTKYFSSMTLQGYHRHIEMTVLKTSLHPLFYFAIETLLVSFGIGFLPARSHARLVLLPLIALCSYGIIHSGHEYIRSLWVSPLSGFANGIVLQYFDLGLLRSWDFETQSKVLLMKEKPDIQNLRMRLSCVIDRLRFGFLSIFSMRKINTPYEIKNTPQFRSGRAPLTLDFFLLHTLKLLVCTLILDISSQLPAPSNPTELFSTGKIQVMSRVGAITTEQIIIRLVGSFIYWINLFAVLQGVFSVTAVLTVGLGLSHPGSWKPLFGPMHSATSIRGFWGYDPLHEPAFITHSCADISLSRTFWHQSLRDALYQPASFLSHRVLQLGPGVLARYTKLFLAFLISGLMHASADAAMGLDLRHSGSIHFFCTQFMGIMLEDCMTALCSKRWVPKTSTNLTLRYFLGFIWVACFLGWSTPAWFYPDMARGPKASFLPFSILRFLLP